MIFKAITVHNQLLAALIRTDVVCGYLEPGSFDVFELESAFGVPVFP